jgi:ATP-dependent helicase/DNAse subunit B
MNLMASELTTLGEEEVKLKRFRDILDQELSQDDFRQHSKSVSLKFDQRQNMLSKLSFESKEPR